jgi:hypothetical protein
MDGSSRKPVPWEYHSTFVETCRIHTSPWYYGYRLKKPNPLTPSIPKLLLLYILYSIAVYGKKDRQVLH